MAKSVSANLNSISDESTSQTQKGITALSGFFPVGDQTTETVQPGVRALNHLVPGLFAFVLWAIILAPAFGCNMRDIIFPTNRLMGRIIVEGRIQAEMLRGGITRLWANNCVIGQ
jgi:hypothetical protein